MAKPVSTRRTLSFLDRRHLAATARFKRKFDQHMHVVRGLLYHASINIWPLWFAGDFSARTDCICASSRMISRLSTTSFGRSGHSSASHRMASSGRVLPETKRRNLGHGGRYLTPGSTAANSPNPIPIFGPTGLELRPQPGRSCNLDRQRAKRGDRTLPWLARQPPHHADVQRSVTVRSIGASFASNRF